MTLKDGFNIIAQRYIEEFCKKHDRYFDYAVADDMGGIICISNEYFFNFNDIRFDIDNDCPKELIFQWQDDCLENDPKYINYQSYFKGLRFEDLEQDKTTKSKK